jgi:hypothetical protein
MPFLEIGITYSKPTYALLKPSIFRKSAQAERACIAAISNRQGLVQDMRIAFLVAALCVAVSKWLLVQLIFLLSL